MRGTILVVEDEADLAATCARLLRRQGWQVEVAGTAAAALGALARRPALVVVDRQLPDGDGLEIVRAAATARTPVLVVSGRDWTDTRRRALDIGAAGFLGKPFSGQALLARIETILGPPPGTPPPDPPRFSKDA